MEPDRWNNACASSYLVARIPVGTDSHIPGVVEGSPKADLVSFADAVSLLYYLIGRANGSNLHQDPTAPMRNLLWESMLDAEMCLRYWGQMARRYRSRETAVKIFL